MAINSIQFLHDNIYWQEVENGKTPPSKLVKEHLVGEELPMGSSSSQQEQEGKILLEIYFNKRKTWNN